MVRDWLQLLHTPGLGTTTFHQLLVALGSPARILQASDTQLEKLGLKTASIRALKQVDAATIDADLEWASADNHHILCLSDKRYPAQLKTIDTAPPVLFVRGDPDYLQRPQLAMVGSRNPTAAGKRTASDFAQHLANAGITITSGLAYGIDGASHEGALKGIAGSIAVVAHGPEIVYPARHQQLAEALSQHGAVITEFPPGTEPQRGLFPRRNRLISGLSMGTLVVEAALKSGSLITARLAMEQNREVFAIPGSIHNPLARGCHQLIRQGAKLVETADDILEELVHHLNTDSLLPATITSQVDNNQASQIDKLDPDHQKLLKCLPYEPVAIDELVDCSGFTAAEVASMLLIMELEGKVVCEGGLYSRIK